MKNKAMLSSDFGFLPLPPSLLLSLCRFFVVDNAKARDFGRGCGVEKLAAYGDLQFQIRKKTQITVYFGYRDYQ